MARLAVTDIKPKDLVRVHTFENVTWMSDLGLDDHSAMSLTAGLLRPSTGGAWQYVADRANWVAGSFNHHKEVVVHCRRSSKKVFIDPASQLEIICRTEKLIESQATHVVVAITYGLEAICVFSDQKSNDGDSVKMLDYAQLFADGLLNGRRKLEPDQDDEDGLQIIPLNSKCILYRDSISGKKESSWTLKPVSEQYIACRRMLHHQVESSVPLKVWLYPLSNLFMDKAGISKQPVDVSRDLIICCQMMWDQLTQIRVNIGSLVDELGDIAGTFIPPSVYKTVKDFDGLMTKFATALLKALSEWTVSVRRGAGMQEDAIAKMMDEIEKKSALASEELKSWLKPRREFFSHQPGVRFVFEAENLRKELKSGSSFAVVLHLPSLAGQSNDQLREMNLLVDSFHPWATKDTKFAAFNSADNRRIFTAVRNFSDWVTGHNGDTDNVKYFVFYEEQLGTDVDPFMRLWNCSSSKIWSTNFTIPKAPGEVTVDSNQRGVLTLSWTAEGTVELIGYLIQYRNVEEEEIWESIQHPPSKKMVINFLQSEETYVFRVAAMTQGGRSPFGPVSKEVTINPVCPPPTGLKSRYVTDTSIAISWDLKTNDNKDSENLEKKVKVTSYSIDCWMAGHQESTFIQRLTPDKQVTLEPLLPDTAYCVQIRAVCVDGISSTIYSPACPVFQDSNRRTGKSS